MQKQKLIITISGDPGSGKSTIAKELAEKLKAKRIYVGQIRREIAKKKGMTLEELNKYAETHPETDIDVDKKVAKQARELANKHNIIVEGRTQFYFIPESLKIYIKVDLDEGIKRIWNSLQNKNDKKLRNEGEIDSLEDLNESVKQRITSDKKRYKKYYKIDHTKESNYDLIIDTTNLQKKEALEKVYKEIKALTKNEK